MCNSGRMNLDVSPYGALSKVGDGTPSSAETAMVVGSLGGTRRLLSSYSGPLTCSVTFWAPVIESKDRSGRNDPSKYPIVRST